jgi:hypothetical protein
MPPGIEFPRAADAAARAEGPRVEEEQMIRMLLVAFVVFLIATFPATWLLMLFLGNVGLNLSYWGTLPLGILVSTLLASGSARSLD